MIRWETLGNGQLPEVAWERFMEKKNKELDRLNSVYMKLLDGAGVEYFEGRGKIIDAHTLEVDGKRFTVWPCCWCTSWAQPNPSRLHRLRSTCHPLSMCSFLLMSVSAVLHFW